MSPDIDKDVIVQPGKIIDLFPPEVAGAITAMVIVSAIVMEEASPVSSSGGV
jgi:hypothetical protein